MQRLLNDQVISQVKQVFDEQLQSPVEVIFFEKKSDCQYCQETLQLVHEVIAISDKLTVKVYDLDENADLAKMYAVDKAPCLVIAARQEDQVVDFGIRIAGIPSGHEFSTLIHDLILVSGRDSGLNQKTREELKKLSKPVFLQVFVTPT